VKAQISGHYQEVDFLSRNSLLARTLEAPLLEKNELIE
jgi:hypothetical protein